MSEKYKYIKNRMELKRLRLAGVDRVDKREISDNDIISLLSDYEAAERKIVEWKTAWETENAAVKKADERIGALRTMSTVEMMCENENVRQHVTEWENRCLKAENDLDRIKNRADYLGLMDFPEKRHCVCGRDAGFITPLAVVMRSQRDEKRIKELEALLKAAREAIERLMPFVHEQNMEGESDYELAILNLEKVLKQIGKAGEKWQWK